jgi:FKBP-type peptidyl-prolyl cis-trans isomerase
LLTDDDAVRNAYKAVLPDLAVGVTTYLNIELVKLNTATWEQFSSGLLLALVEPVSERRCARTVVDGDRLAVEYEGSLENGTVFDSSRQRGAPFGPFVHGRGQIIRGYEVALAGRCLCERFKMIVPPHLAYGEAGMRGANHNTA